MKISSAYLSIHAQYFVLLLCLATPGISDPGAEEHVENPQDGPETQQSDQTAPPTSAGIHYAFSPIHLTYLAKVEKTIYNTLGSYEKALQQRLDKIRRYRSDYDDSVLPALSIMEPERIILSESEAWARATFLSSHPLLVYRMMSRYALGLQDFYEDITRNLENGVLSILEEQRAGAFWPSHTDLEDVSRALFRLQDVYGLNPAQFAEGLIHGIQTSVGLKASQSLDLAETALFLGDSLTAGEWLGAARGKVNAEDDSLHIDDLIQPWERAVRLHGKTWNIDDFGIDDVFQESRRLVDVEYQESKWNLSYINRIQNYKALCRGEIPPSSTKRNIGACFLLPGPDSYFKINPVRVEIHSRDPPILEFHSFFGDRLIGDVSLLVFQPLVQSAQHDTGKEKNFLDTKTTAPTWIWDKVPGLEGAFTKLEKIMGHPISGREEHEPVFYMQAFSVGNYYEPCLECEEDIPEVLEKVGGRIATAEFILDETESGGETVFPQIGLRISPRKGSVLLFLDEGNASQDFRRLRATCPVVLGQKWVASKFIYERGQCLKSWLETGQ